MRDFQKIVVAGLKDLYLKMVEVYTESAGSDTNISAALQDFFSANAGIALDIDRNLKDPETFVEAMDYFYPPNGTDSMPSYSSQSDVVKALIQQYDMYGIPTPPDGFLQIDSGAKKWWKTKVVEKNGYFINVEIAKVNKKEKTVSFKNKTYSPVDWPLNFTSLLTALNGKQKPLKSVLLGETKKAYFGGLDPTAAADEGGLEELNETDILDDYFLILDQDANSFHFELDPNGNTGKLYIRIFFNEYGQKLNAGAMEISGIDEIKKIPSGIRKNFVIENLFSGIDAFEKYYTSEGPPTKKTQSLIDGLQNTKKIIKKIIKDKTIPEDATIGFIFDDKEGSKYKFITIVDGNNKSISTKPLYSFLKDRVILNKYISTLNAINCQLVGEAVSANVVSVGASPANYKHLEAAPAAATRATTKKQKAKKASNYKISRSSLKFVGDATLRYTMDAIASNPKGATIKHLYETYFNKVDLAALAAASAKYLAKNIKIPDLRKVYFRAFIDSLDITELVDCVAEQAGKMKFKVEIEKPVFDGKGKLKLTPTKDYVTEKVTISVDEELDFERDLKIRLYLVFSTFYNAAKSHNPKLFNYPASDEDLPSPGSILSNPLYYADVLEKANSDIFMKKVLYDTAKSKEEKTGEPIPDKIQKEYDEAVDAKTSAENNYLTSLDVIDIWLKKTFPYLLIIPESQRSQIYATIVGNEPQYKNNTSLIDPLGNGQIPGILDARDDPAFWPTEFISILFAKTIIRYADGLSEGNFTIFYDNIAKKNKKLKTSAQLEKERKKAGASADSLGNAAKTNKSKLPKVVNLNFGSYVPIFDYSAMISAGMDMATKAAMLKVLEKLQETTTDGANKELCGDEDMLNALPPSQHAFASSNDMGQNIIDAENSKYNSAMELIFDAQKNVFPGNTIEEIQCLFKALFSEVPVQIQLRFVLQKISSGSMWAHEMQSIFETCGLPSDTDTVDAFFIWLADIINESGALDAIFKKVITASEIASNNADPCDDDTSYKGNLPTSPTVSEKMMDNERRAAEQQLSDLLSLLSDKNLKNSQPSMNLCPATPGQPAMLPDQYGPVQIYQLDKLVRNSLDSINESFNSDISAFKPIILEQNKPPGGFGGQDPSSISNDDYEKSEMGQFTSGSGDAKEGWDPDSKKSLQKIITDAVNEANFLVDKPGPGDWFTTASGLHRFKAPATDNIILYIIFNPPESAAPGGGIPQEYLGQDIEADSTSIIIINNNLPGKISDQVIFYSGKMSDYIDVTYALDIIMQSSWEPGNSINGFWVQTSVDYAKAYGLDFMQLFGEFVGIQVVNAFYGGKNGSATDLSAFAQVTLSAIVTSLLKQFVSSFNLFTTATFTEVPLKDNEAAEIWTAAKKVKIMPSNPDYNKEYSDGGILSKSDMFAKYKNQRKSLQCVLPPDALPDVHQIAQLTSLYQSLINVCIVEDLLESFFSLNIKGDIAGLESTRTEKVLVNKITNSFTNSVSRIGNLQTDYKTDMRMIYKYDLLDNPTTENIEKLANIMTVGDSEVILHFIQKTYSTLLSKIQNRIRVSVPDYTFNETKDIKNAVLLPNPNGAGSVIWPVYTGINGTSDDPANYMPELKGLHEGVIVQSYVDIKQNGRLIATAIEKNVSINDYLPIIGTVASGADKDKTVIGDLDSLQEEYGQINITVGEGSHGVYTDHFFRSNREGIVEGGSKTGLLVVSYEDPDANFGEGQGKLKWHSPAGQIKVGYMEDFATTQGKITIKDFKAVHEDRTTKDMAYTGAGTYGNLVTGLLEKNGPKTYYDKAAVGLRICLVIDETTAQKLTDGNTSILDMYHKAISQLGDLDDPIAEAANLRFLIKEKVIKYRNPDTLEVFAVVPIMVREVDILHPLETAWKSTGGWSWRVDMNSKILSAYGALVNDVGPNSSLKNLVDSFTNIYKPSFFEDLVPIALKEILADKYSNQLNTLFDSTKEEVAMAIRILKMAINREWDTDLSSSESPGEDGLDAMYIMLAMSLLGIVVKAGANLADPTWRTPWFFPGPATPIGFLAKILP